MCLQGYEGVREGLNSKKNPALTAKSVDSNMNKKNKKKKEEEEVELPSKKNIKNRQTQTIFAPCLALMTVVPFLCSHTVSRHHLHRSGARRGHHQQGFCDHHRGQSHPDREVVAGPAGRGAGL